MVWRYAAASVAGASHKAAGTPCQDQHRCCVVTESPHGPTLVAVVSDGAGGATHGAAGAALTAALLHGDAAGWLRDGGSVRTLDRARLSTWIGRVRDAIAGAAATGRAETRDFAATLLLAVIDDASAAFAQIGDGAIVTSDAPGEWSAQFWPKHGVYANQTFFITDEDAHDRLAFAHSLYPVREVAIFTDGLERVLLDFGERKAHTPAFEKMLQPLRAARGEGNVDALSSALAGYLASPVVASRTDDDVTLVIGTRQPPAAPAG
jgi:hypothetical protein